MSKQPLSHNEKKNVYMYVIFVDTVNVKGKTRHLAETFHFLFPNLSHFRIGDLILKWEFSARVCEMCSSVTQKYKVWNSKKFAKKY